MKNKRTARRADYANQHANIKSRPNEAAFVGGVTFTNSREDDFDVHAFTSSNNVSSLYLRLGQFEANLTGRQARTLQRLLNKHYSNCGTPTILGA